MEMAHFKIFRNYGVRNFDDKEKETIDFIITKTYYALIIFDLINLPCQVSFR